MDFDNENDQLDSDEKYLEEDWVVYLTNIDETQPASILVDLSLNQIAPIDEKSKLICFSIYMNNPREDGLSSSEESPTLNSIEDEIVQELSENQDAIYIGRINSARQIRSHFYGTGNEDVKSILEKVKTKNPEYKIESQIIEDKDWSVYFEVFYPQPVEMQMIQNNKVLMNLEGHGDNLEKERQVDHWIYFKTRNDRERFLNEIKDENFEVVEKEDTDDDELKFSLQIKRIDKVDYESVDDYVIYLWETAQKFDGEYDGWETFVIRD